VEDKESKAGCTPALLREIGLFGALSDEILEFLVEMLEVVPFKPGETVFREGDSARHMYVVLNGELEVLKNSRTGHEMRVAVLGGLDWFGEMSLLDVQPRSATVRSLAHSRLLLMSSAHFDALYRRDLKSYSLVVLNIAREISRRLRVADGLLAEIVVGVRDVYAPRSGAS
jgi:CRP/FNR family transcriptional regulator, cyclic AMP receptor protein